MLCIFSGGRSGTNLVLEMFTEHSYFCASDYPEDKLLLKRKMRYPSCYLTKMDTVYCKDYQELKEFMALNSECKLIWTVRHPYDWAMSKIYRGRPLPKRGGRPADDFDPEVCVNDLYYVKNLYERCSYDFTGRNTIVKIENIILDIKQEALKLCSFLSIPFEDSLLTPHLRMRHVGKVDRYGRSIDKSQIDLYKKWDEVYDGYFKNRRNILQIFQEVDPLVDYFDYRI